MSMDLNSTYWSARYNTGDTGWDIGYAAPALTEYFDEITNKHTRIFIPGCGNAHEVGYLLEKGFTKVHVIDIAPNLTASLAKKYQTHNGKSLHIYTGDFFEHAGEYDVIIEQTFFCALDPTLRKNYVKKMHELLANEGELAGVLFNRSFEGGPPFGGSREEYVELFQSTFNRVSIEPCNNSIPPRKNAEVFIRIGH